MSGKIILVVSMLAISTSIDAQAQTAPTVNDWAALASDRHAHAVGDSLSVLILESSSASNILRNDTNRSHRLNGRAAAGSLNETADFSLGRSLTAGGQTSRQGRLAAQISVIVDRVLPNGDLHVSGGQVLNVNGERTEIRLQGRVRPMDIDSDNSILSSRLADATIDYDGSGFVSRGGGPGLITRVFDWLGLP